jgi:N-acetylmuramoyl-L-alanine amidase
MYPGKVIKFNAQIKTVCWFALSVLLVFLTAFLNIDNNVSATTSISPGEYRIRSIVIDAGHGGKDPGCHGPKSKEKDIALSIATELGALINSQFPEIQVIFTRDKDIFIPLHERAAIANRNQADLFISIHCNYVAKRNRAEGSETYVMGLHRAKDNLDVAKRENAAILMEDDYEAHYDGYDPESPEGHIILSMYQNAFLEQSILFAQQIEEEFVRQAKRKSRGVKQAGFLVLRETTMPSVLIETGFLSHDQEERFLLKKENQKRMAASILTAFKKYKNTVETPVKELSRTNVVEVELLVQIAASKQKYNLDDVVWKKVENLQTKKEEDYYKYLVGPFSRPETATKAQNRLRSNGFETAFVVAYRRGQRIKMNEALSLLDR